MGCAQTRASVPRLCHGVCATWAGARHRSLPTARRPRSRACARRRGRLRYERLRGGVGDRIVHKAIVVRGERWGDEEALGEGFGVKFYMAEPAPHWKWGAHRRERLCHGCATWAGTRQGTLRTARRPRSRACARRRGRLRYERQRVRVGDRIVHKAIVVRAAVGIRREASRTRGGRLGCGRERVEAVVLCMNDGLHGSTCAPLEMGRTRTRASVPRRLCHVGGGEAPDSGNGTPPAFAGVRAQTWASTLRKAARGRGRPNRAQGNRRTGRRTKLGRKCCGLGRFPSRCNCSRGCHVAVTWGR